MTPRSASGALALSVREVLAFWGITVLLLVGTMLVASSVLFVYLRLAKRSVLRQDLEEKVRRKRRLPSGGAARFGYVYFLGLLLLDNGFQATVLYRTSRSLAAHGLRLPAEVLHSLSKLITNIDVSPHARIGPGVSFYHGLGIVIGKLTEIGSRVTICQGVTTGSGRPRIGDDVILWSGAKVIGDVTVGDRAEVGAGAVVIDDVPPDCVAVGVPANRFLPRTAGRPGERKAPT